MKRLKLNCLIAYVLVGLFVVPDVNGRGAVTQAAKLASKVGITGQQAAALRLAWDNLLRGYEDLLSTPPDVRGDTSTLEGHIKAAMNQLHAVDPSAIPVAPASIPVQDKGRTRQFILDAVRGHLQKAKNVIEGAKVSHPDVQQALGNITVAEGDVTEIQATPAKK